MQTPICQPYLEAEWQKILPNGVYLSCGSLTNSYPELTALELNSFAAPISHHRLAELTAGRYHAKQGLRHLNLYACDLPRSIHSKAPDWPNNTKGSITHVGNGEYSHVAAVVADVRYIGSIGIDAEIHTDLHHSMWDQFMTSRELHWVVREHATIRLGLVSMVWCLKEAALKAGVHADMREIEVIPCMLHASNLECNFVCHHGNTYLGRASLLEHITIAVVYTT